MLRDWLLYLKRSQSQFTLSQLATQTGLSVSYLSMLFQGKRPLTRKTLPPLAAALGWEASEIKKIELLCSFANSKNDEEKHKAFTRIAKRRAFQRINPQEAIVYEYLSQWYHIAIREMAALSDFNPDPEWIQLRLWKKIGRSKIAASLEFLFAHGFLEKRPDGSVSPPDRQLDCQGQVYRLALKRFYGQMYDLAAKSIDSVPADRRNLQSFTLAIGRDRFEQIKLIIEQTYKQVEQIAKESPPGDDVYHVSLALFPFTHGKPDGDGETS